MPAACVSCPQNVVMVFAQLDSSLLSLHATDAPYCIPRVQATQTGFKAVQS